MHLRVGNGNRCWGGRKRASLGGLEVGGLPNRALKR